MSAPREQKQAPITNLPLRFLDISSKIAAAKDHKNTEIKFDDEKVHLKNEIIKEFKGHQNKITVLVVLPNGNFISGDEKGVIKAWDAENEKCLQTVDLRSPLLNIELLENGSIVCAYEAEGLLGILFFDTNLKPQNHKTLKVEENVGFVKVLRENFLAIVTYNEIALWDFNFPKDKPVQVLSGTKGRITAITSTNNLLVSSSRDGTIKFWNLDQRLNVLNLREPNENNIVTALLLLPNNRIAAGTDNGSIEVWDYLQKKCLMTLRDSDSEKDRSSICNLSLLSENYLIGSSLNETLWILWDLNTGKFVSWEATSDWITKLSVLPNGNLLTSGDDYNLKIWKILTRSITLKDIYNFLYDLGTFSHLKSLSLQHCAITDADIQPSVLGFLSRSHLHQLDLRNTLITEAGLKTILDKLKNHPTLKTILHEKNINTINEEKLIPHNPILPQKEPDPFSISFLINYNEVKVENRIGHGAFGVVHKGTWRYNDVAIKTIADSKSISKEEIAIFEKEVKTQISLRGQYIVQTFGFFLHPHPGIVMEFMPKGSLFNYLHSEATWDWKLGYRFLTDMTSGLAFLHASNIIHRDIKSLNVLLDEFYRAKLSDFGLAKAASTQSTASIAKGVVGTLSWMAPELFEAKKPEYNQKTDIYSLGITFWEIASRKIPYAEEENPFLVPEKVKKGHREKIPNCPPTLAKLITWCWNTDPKERPSADKVLNELKDAAMEFNNPAPLNSFQASVRR